MMGEIPCRGVPLIPLQFYINCYIPPAHLVYNGLIMLLSTGTCLYCHFGAVIFEIISIFERVLDVGGIPERTRPEIHLDE